MSEKPDWRIQWLVAQAKDERLTDAEVRSIIANFPHDAAPAMTPDNLREAVALTPGQRLHAVHAKH